MMIPDSTVLAALDPKKPRLVAKISRLTGIHPFKLTARLASLAKRGLAIYNRDDKTWLRGYEGDIPPEVKDVGDARDRQLPHLKARNMKHWSYRVHCTPNKQVTCAISPKTGKEYIPCESSREKADLIIDCEIHGIRPGRWKLLKPRKKTKAERAHEKKREWAKREYANNADGHFTDFPG